MSRTYKRFGEHKSDGWHVGRRLERQARPAGRMLAVLEAETAAEGDEDEQWLAPWVVDVSEAVADFIGGSRAALPWGPGWCGCPCRRCRMHHDCGGCLTGHAGTG